ncbi:hypothetical protein, partial [Rhodoplanes roseus]
MVHHEWSLPDGASAPSRRLAAALREARIASAEQTGVVVELREAEIARLDILHEMLAPLFAEVPTGIELFDPGVSGGETPRLWVDAVAHVAMGRDRRTYRFLQDTRSGRKVRAETADVREMAEAVTRYVAQRLVERERTLSGDPPEPAAEAAWRPPRRR